MSNLSVVSDLENQWHKLCTLVIWKYKLDRVELTVEDFRQFERENGSTKVLLADVRGGQKIRLTIMEEAQALKIAREANLS